MKAKIFPYFARAYKHGNENIPEQTTALIPVGQYDFNIGTFENIINLENFDAVYYSNDVNQEHPIYILKTDKKPEKIDLNGETVSTFFINDNDYNDLADGFAVKTDKVIGCGFGSDNRNFTSPDTIDGEVAPEDRYNKIRYDNGSYPYQTTGEYTYIETSANMVPRAKYMFETLFTNGTIEGIRAVYDSRDDSMMVPAMNMETQRFEFYGLNTQEVYLRSWRNVYAGDVIYNSINFAGSRATLQWSGMFELLNEIQEDDEEKTYSTFLFPIPWTGTDASSYSFQYGQSNAALRQNTGKQFPIFLKDANGEYWVMLISRVNAYDSQEYPDRNIQLGNWGIVVVKVKDLPVNPQPVAGNISSSAANWITTEQFTSPEVVDKFLDVVFSIKSGPNYDDDGPDAIGPGDPYEDENNAGESVGGDANIVDDITPPDMTPNTSYESYVIDNGLYGSYLLTTANLRNYTKTLQLCRDSSWVPGELGDKFENMGNLIQENTVSVFMLPVGIEETTAVPFNVGTKAIRNTDIVGNWGDPNSVDRTSLINKYTKEYVYPLGTISHYYDNFLDFAPYSTASLYIPYIGKVELPINLVQSTSTDQKQLSLSIRLNRTNGDILCILLSNNIPLCRWQGNCARSIALSVNDNSAILQNQFSRLVSSFSSGLGALGAAATGNVGGATSNLGQMFAAPMASGAPITTSSHMIGNAPETGDVGWMDSQLITLTVERPIWWKPYDYGDLIGYPTRKIAKLATVSGFAKVPNIHIRCSATESEKERLKAMLAEGVLF